MLRLIIFFAILVIWVIVNVINARRRFNAAPDGNGKTGRKPVRKPSAGKKYSWTWMQAAGALQLKFIRPEQANGYPAINGTVDGITVLVQCIPPSGTAQESMVFRFHFPEPAGIGLELMTAGQAEELPEKTGSDQTGLLIELLEKRPIGACFMQVAAPEVFRCCMNSDGLEHLSRLSLIYSKVLLTDSELQVRTAGINNDPVRFREQLQTLLDIAGAFAGFARRAAERKKMTIKPAVPEEVEKKRPPEPEKTPAEPVRRETQPGTEQKQTMLPQDRSAFLNLLWQSGIPAGRQKELFAEYAGNEVEWDGVLKTCFSFSNDLVFGQDGGVKASFELEEIRPAGSFMPIKIRAVTAFPKTELAKLDKAAGKTFRFRGKLLKIEPIAREIYLSCGIITGAS